MSIERKDVLIRKANYLGEIVDSCPETNFKDCSAMTEKRGE